MTDNPIRRLVGDYARRLVPDGFTPSADFLDRALTDAVQENEMTEQSMTAAEAEHLIAEACLDAGMVGREVEIIAAIRRDERDQIRASHTDSTQVGHLRATMACFARDSKLDGDRIAHLGEEVERWKALARAQGKAV